MNNRLVLRTRPFRSAPGGKDKYPHMLLVLGWWSLVLLELSNYKSRVGSHLRFLACSHFSFPYTKYCIALSLKVLWGVLYPTAMKKNHFLLIEVWGKLLGINFFPKKFASVYAKMSLSSSICDIWTIRNMTKLNEFVWNIKHCSENGAQVWSPQWFQNGNLIANHPRFFYRIFPRFIIHTFLNRKIWN